MRSLKVYCDGACKKNDIRDSLGVGGWGVVIYDDNFTWNAYGGKKNTTNQEMELQAMNQALRVSSVGLEIELFSDSMFVLQGLILGGKHSVLTKKSDISGWVKKWRSKGWVKADGSAIKHLELWKLIVEKCENHLENGSKITLTWVKGHSDSVGNDRADELANLGVKSV